MKIPSLNSQTDELLHKVLNTINDAIFLHDPEGQILAVNESMLRMYGVSSEEAITLSITEAYSAPGADREQLRSVWARALEGEKQSFDWRARRPGDGTEFPVRVHLSAITVADRQMILAVVRDTSEESRTRRQLVRTRDRVRRLHEVAFELENAESLEQVYTVAITAAESILDLSICTLDILEDGMLVPKAKSRTTRTVPMSPNEGIAGMTFRNRKTYIIDDLRNDPRARPASSGYRSLISVPLGDVGIFQGVSSEVEAFSEDDAELVEILASHVAQAVRRIRAGNRLREGRERYKKLAADYQESEEKYRVLAEEAHDLIVIVREGRFIYVNPACEHILGHSPGELTGRHWSLVLDEANRDSMLGMYRRWLETGSRGSFRLEAALQHRDGNRVHVEMTGSAITYDGETATLVMARNITERKQAEERLRYVSLHDQLTGVYNRTYFDDALARLDVPRQHPISLIMADLNGLKMVNDAFGHRAGDRLLKLAAEVLEENCRAEDIVARIGGDEFAIILPGTPSEVVQERMKYLEQACSKQTFRSLSLSLSFGWATRNQDDRIGDVLQRAEERMYRSKMLRSDSARSALITSLRKTLTEKTLETEEHFARLETMSTAIGEAVGLDRSQLDDLALLAQLHDIGKVAISHEILRKSRALEESEVHEVRRHPEIGYRIARSSTELAPIAAAILAHHEWYDGQGYPRGLKGDQIPLLARILAVVDAFDAMTSERPYRKALSCARALEELNRCAGTQFDPALVQVFSELVQAGELHPVIRSHHC